MSLTERRQCSAGKGIRLTVDHVGKARGSKVGSDRRRPLLRGRPVSLAKTTRPRASGILARPRLFKLLDLWQQRPIIWVSGPPGAGKTSLLASYLDARALSSLWYQLDEDDADPATFFYYLRQAAYPARSRNRSSLPLLTPEYRLGLPAFTRRFFRALYGCLDQPFLLVLDGYHHIPSDSPFHAMIQIALGELPNEGGAVIISRHEPPSCFASLRVRTLMQMIGSEALRLTLNEARAIRRLRGGRPMPRVELEALHEQTGGWAAGLIMTLEVAAPDASGPRGYRPHAATLTSIFDFLADEVLNQVDHDTQDFLLKTAFLPKMTARMANRLVGGGEAAGILARLHGGNYFTEMRPLSDPVYQYHRLFREFLLARARRTLAPAMLTAIQRNAAAILAEAGEIEEAAHLLIQAEDWEGFTQLILEQAPALLAQGRTQIVQEWLNKLPHHLIEQQPQLSYWLGMCRLPYTPDRSRGCFAQAFDLFRQQHDTEGALLSWSRIVESFLAEWGDFSALDPWTHILEEILAESPVPLSPDIEARVATARFCAYMFRQPHHPRTRDAAAHALQMALTGNDIDHRLLTGFHATLYRLWIGDIAGATLIVTRCRETIRGRRTLPPHLTLMWNVAEAACDWHNAMHERCLKIVSDSLEMARATGLHLWDYQLLSQGVYGAITGGDLAQAESYLAAMASVLEGSRRLDASQYHYLAAWLADLRGDLALAFSHAERARDLSIKAGAPFPEALTQLAIARILQERGDDRQAVGALAAARAIGKEMQSTILRFMCLLTEAHFGFARAGDANALAALREAMALGRTQGFLNTPWWQPSIMARLCVKALETGIEVKYVQDLVRKRHLIPDTVPVHVENWPWTFRVYTLGGFKLVGHDSEMTRPSRKTPQKPLAMLKLLIADDGQEVAENRLTDTLWPDAPGDAAYEACTTTLYRLRRLLGQEDRAITLHEGRLSLERGQWWVDAWAFEALLDQAEQAERAGDLDRAMRLTEQAARLYRGPFLATDADEPWALATRERLRSRFIRRVGWLGRRWEQAGHWERAIECYERALGAEPLAEELYQWLIACYGRLGRSAEALGVYRRCQSILVTLLHTTPSPDTETLIQAVRRQEGS